MTSHNIPKKSLIRNPVPGPAEMAAVKGVSAQNQIRNRTAQRTTPTAQPLQPPVQPVRSQHAHPLLPNLKDRRQEIREITPAIAKEILNHWNRRNRPLMKEKLRALVKDMREGRFVEDNGEAVTFDTNGDLIDGQHRLTAIIETGLTASLLVVSGLKPEVRETVDIGASRTIGQILGMTGYELADAVGRAAALLMAYEEDELTFKIEDIPTIARPNKTEIPPFVKAHAEELSVAVKLSKEKIYENPFMKKQGLNIFLFVLFNRQNPDLAKLFLYQISSGFRSPADRSGLNAGHPVLELRNVLFTHQKEFRRYPTSYLIGVILRAWIAVRDGTPFRMIKPEPRPKFKKTKESFPDIDANWPPASAAATQS